MPGEELTWCNSESLSLISRPENRVSGDRRFLVYMVARPHVASSLHGLRQEERNFDLAVRFYAKPAHDDQLLREADYVMTGGLSKFHAAAQFLELCELADRYEGYLFVDGDLEFDAGKLADFLALARAARLDLAQPSITRDSYSYWRMAFHQPRFLFRETSFVEVMAPYMSRAALATLLPTFARSISSYGLDFVWPSLLGNGRIGVVDAFQVRHAERVDFEGGAFYRYLATLGIDPIEEGRRLLSEYGVRRVQPYSRRGYLKAVSADVSEGACLTSVFLPPVERFTKSQFAIDLAMNLASRGPARAEPELTDALRPVLAAR